ncbi:MAG TPA: polyphosphate:AMP phosphotransferase [Casimicrobiaceae bacterium]|nr:polyphosphate:AMP phosphotransferase [Casimicrobiaceae bacterium]
MLESAEVGHRIDKRQYNREEPRLRESLVLAQFDLAAKQRGPLLLIIAGVIAAGRHETANQLTTWMDPRHIGVAAFKDPAPEEAVRPPAWRSWRNLPPRGRIGIFMGGWYADLIAARCAGNMEDAEFDDRLLRIRQHEEMLAAEGVVLLKYWIHLSKAAQKQRIAEIESDPDERWRITGEDKKAMRAYNKGRPVWEHVLSTTSLGIAPWYVVEGTDERYRDLTIGKLTLEALRKAVSLKHAPVASDTAAPAPAVIGNVEVIRRLDLSHKVAKRTYEDELPRYEGRLFNLVRHKRFRHHALVLGFEGLDAAGKGGAIRRVTGALDAGQYVVVPIAAPNDEERAHPYLWRFWQHVPACGGITIFDRTWYGRVLVERIEGLCSESDWMRAYDEINQFERQLTEFGIVLCKFWLQISKAEQLRRFRAREKTAFKRFKITREDWHNRSRWDAYEQAVADMVDRTSTESVPWSLIEAEDKRYARVKILQAICERLEEALD